MMLRAAAVLLLALVAFACQRSPRGELKEAVFGVFFGGQVQELRQLPKQLDASRQKHGFRLTFARPLERPLSVTWEISLPAGDRGGPRAALVGQATAQVGQSVLDVPLAFRPSDPLGVWHAKVLVDGAVVIDREFTVVAPPR